MTDDMLADIFKHQLDLQVQRFRDPSQMARDDALEFILWNVVACTDELHEALNEVGWKPWASARHINRNEYVGELIDAMHFIVNLCLVVGVTPEEFHARYLSKNEKNHRRQLEGYTGEKDAQGREID